MKIDRVKTGIEGLDELLQGGFPKGHCVLLSGAPGTGKTIFGLQYLYEGAKNGEKCLYFIFNESEANMHMQASIFGWDTEKLIADGNLRIVCRDVRDFKLREFVEELKSEGYQRIVLDSLSSILSHPVDLEDLDVLYTLKDRLERMVPSPLHENVAMRLMVEKVIGEIKKLPGCNSIIISELVEGKGGMSRDTISEFLVDGVLTMQFVMVGIESSRNLMIRKMRATAHSENIHPIEFEEGVGMKVLMP